MTLQLVTMFLMLIILGMQVYCAKLARESRKLSREIKDLDLELLASVAEWKAKLARLPF